MVEIKIEVPKELEVGAKMLGKEELSRIVCEVLKEQLSRELMFKLADELLKESKLTDELALRFGDELKERVAKRHGL
jgi:polyhydroxyalkanoate synthesis regulator phasin